MSRNLTIIILLILAVTIIYLYYKKKDNDNKNNDDKKNETKPTPYCVIPIIVKFLKDNPSKPDDWFIKQGYKPPVRVGPGKDGKWYSLKDAMKGVCKIYYEIRSNSASKYNGLSYYEIWALFGWVPPVPNN